MKYYLLIIFCASFVLMNTLSAQHFTYTPLPDWVKAVKIPEETTISKYDISSGAYSTLTDYQYHLDKNAYFKRDVLKVVSYGGVNSASQLSVQFDTSYQTLEVHYLHVIRKGKTIDRTEDISLETLNNESELHQGIYHGKVTVHDILDDIRKDDLIDFAYTLVGDNPIFDDEEYLVLPLQQQNPTDLLFYRVLFSNDKDIKYECHACEEGNMTVKSERDFTTIEITRKNTKAFDSENGAPTWMMPDSYFLLSSFSSWMGVNEWAQKIFELEEPQNLQSVFDEVFNGDEITDEKINKLIDFVQDEIRYMGIETGVGSIKPFPPEKVVRQRYGDCKDKALLLSTLLKQIGVQEAYPALVNSFMKKQIDDLYPGNEAFDHVITMFKYNDTTYWLDPTMTQQGGSFRELNCYDYGKALVIGLPDDQLQTMDVSRTHYTNEVVEEYYFDSFNEKVRLEISSSNKGMQADMTRIMLDYINKMEMNKMLTKDLKLLYPYVVQEKPMQIEDNLEVNEFTINYSYHVGDFWNFEGNKLNKEVAYFRYEPLFLYGHINKTGCEDRNLDFEQIYPLNFHYTVIFNFHKELFIEDNSSVIDNDSFYYKERVEQLSPNKVKIEYFYNTTSQLITPDDYVSICEKKNEIVQNTPMVFYFLLNN